MDTICAFNDWLNDNDFKIKERGFDEDLIEEAMNIHKFKSGGRNELDKYMKLLITKYDLMKNDEKILTYKEIVAGYKKSKKAEERKSTKRVNTNKNEQRIIEVNDKLKVDKLIYIDKIEKAMKEMIVELIGNANEKNEWNIKITKNIYSLKIEENIKREKDDEIDILVYGKKLVKRDIKLIADYFTKKRKIEKKTVIINDKIPEKEDEKEEVIDDIKETVNKELHKKLFGEDSDDENEETLDSEIYKEDITIENIIDDIEDIKFE
jgi:hypothetical protein